jgi:hypothetical protein
VYLAARANGNLVVSEGFAGKRIVEVEPTGHVLGVNTDFTGNETPQNVVVDDTDQVYVCGYQEIHTYRGSVVGSRETWVAAGPAPNQTHSALAYGGTPRRVWSLTASSGTAPRMQFVRFDAATAASGGTPTVVADVDRFSVKSFVVDDANNVYAVDSNQCRVRKVAPGGAITVIAGKPAGEQGQCLIGSAVEHDSAGNVLLPQAVALGWAADGHSLILSGAERFIDVTEGADGRSRGTTLVQFAAGTGNESFAVHGGMYFVADVTAHAIKKVVF